MDTFVVGTFTKSKEDYDKRDYRIEDLAMAEEYTISNIPKNFSWRGNIGKTSYQNGRGSCTSLGGTHCMQIQNIEEMLSSYPKESKNIYARLDNGDNIINIKWEDLRVKMGHDLNNKNDSGDYVENMLKALKTKGIEGLDINNNKKIYFSDGFAYGNSPSTDSGLPGFKLNITKSPLVFVIRGNSNTRNEMMQGRITTIVQTKDQTGGHCVAVDGYTEADCEFLNSWRVNGNSDKICSFKIDWSTFKAMVKAGMINRRYWRIFDKKDVLTDLQFLNKKMQAMETVRQLKKSHEKGDNDDKTIIEKSGLGNYFRKKYGFTDNDL